MSNKQIVVEVPKESMALLQAHMSRAKEHALLPRGVDEGSYMLLLAERQIRPQDQPDPDPGLVEVLVSEACWDALESRRQEGVVCGRWPAAWSMDAMILYLLATNAGADRG